MILAIILIVTSIFFITFVTSYDKRKKRIYKYLEEEADKAELTDNL